MGAVGLHAFWILIIFRCCKRRRGFPWTQWTPKMHSPEISTGTSRCLIWPMFEVQFLGSLLHHIFPTYCRLCLYIIFLLLQNGRFPIVAITVGYNLNVYEFALVLCDSEYYINTYVNNFQHLSFSTSVMIYSHRVLYITRMVYNYLPCSDFWNTSSDLRATFKCYRKGIMESDYHWAIEDGDLGLFCVFYEHLSPWA